MAATAGLDHLMEQNDTERVSSLPTAAWTMVEKQVQPCFPPFIGISKPVGWRVILTAQDWILTVVMPLLRRTVAASPWQERTCRWWRAT